MSIYSPNLDKFTSVFFVAPPDTYELEVIKPNVKTVEVTDKTTQQKTKKPVVSFIMRIVSADSSGEEFKDKPVTVDFWLSDDERDWNNLLRFIAAAKGVKLGSDEADDQFRTIAGQMDLSVDAENGKLGAGFDSLKNARVRCALTQTVAKNDPNKMYQKFGMFLPF